MHCDSGQDADFCLLEDEFEIMACVYDALPSTTVVYFHLLTSATLLFTLSLVADTMYRFLATAALALWVTAFAPLATGQDQTVAEIIQGSENFTVLETYLNAGNLSANFSLDSPDFDSTFFAPVNAAFDDVNPLLAERLLTPEWIRHLRCIMAYHIAPGIFLAENLSEGQVLITLRGLPVNVTLSPPGLVAVNNSASIVAADILASNGVIHAVDDVLRPRCIAFTLADRALSLPRFSTLEELIELAGLMDELENNPGPFTLFAPYNIAWEALGEELNAYLRDPANVNYLRAVLLFHLYDGNLYSNLRARDFFALTSVQGSTSYVDGAALIINDIRVVATDILARNGVIHVPDQVLLPPSINDLLVKFPSYTGDALSFTTLISAVELAGLSSVFDIDDLNNPTQYTLLAPTNDALDPVPELLAKFLEPEWVDTHLTQVLLYHVIAGAANSTVVAGLDTVDSVSGETLNITASDEGIMIKTANVVSADNYAYNGVIHAIDELLVPESITQTITELAVGNADLTEVVGALDKADLVGTLEGPGPFTVFAPTNAAFEEVPDDVDVDIIRNILLYHVVSENVVLEDGVVLQTLEGAEVAIRVKEDGTFRVNGANIVGGPVYASNGIVYVIDQILIPTAEPPTQPFEPTTTPAEPTLAPALVPTTTPAEPTLAPTSLVTTPTPEPTPAPTSQSTDGDPTLVPTPTEVQTVAEIVETNFVTLTAYLEGLSLFEALDVEGPITVFAPSDQAFVDVPSDVTSDMVLSALMYHVVAGAVVLEDGAVYTTVQGSNLTITADGDGFKVNDVSIIGEQTASNGVVYAIDEVLLPPAPVATPGPTPAPTPEITVAPVRAPTPQSPPIRRLIPPIRAFHPESSA